MNVHSQSGIKFSVNWLIWTEPQFPTEILLRYCCQVQHKSVAGLHRRVLGQWRSQIFLKLVRPTGLHSVMITRLWCIRLSWRKQYVTLVSQCPTCIHPYTCELSAFLGLPFVGFHDQGGNGALFINAHFLINLKGVKRVVRKYHSWH